MKWLNLFSENDENDKDNKSDDHIENSESYMKNEDHIGGGEIQNQSTPQKQEKRNENIFFEAEGLIYEQDKMVELKFEGLMT